MGTTPEDCPVSPRSRRRATPLEGGAESGRRGDRPPSSIRSAVSGVEWIGWDRVI